MIELITTWMRNGSGGGGDSACRRSEEGNPHVGNHKARD